mgnify:CR=1 FL=1
MPPVNPPQPSRRRFTRVPFHTQVTLACEGSPRECVLIDISLNGALVEDGTALDVPPGTPCALAVHLGDRAHMIRMAGVVAHATEGRLGIQCREIGLESITNLRRLVELNAGDESLLERDLAALIEGG